MPQRRTCPRPFILLESDARCPPDRSARSRHRRLMLRPSNAVVEASDYLTNKHDWVQLEDEVTPPLRRALYEPPKGGQKAEL